MVKKFQINLSNKVFYSLLVIVALAVVGVGVYASSPPPGGAANPGHNLDAIGPPSGCTSGKFLKWQDDAFVIGENKHIPGWVCETIDTSGGPVSSVKSFIGATSASHTGSGVGGYSGGDAKCASQFGTGARMSTAADFAEGVPNVNGWYSTFVWQLTGDTAGSHSIVDCSAWGSASPLQYGPWWTGSAPSRSDCGVSKPILCSQ